MAAKENCRVGVRLRPLAESEKKVMWSINRPHHLIGDSKLWTFDEVFNGEDSTKTVYRSLVAPVVADLAIGISGHFMVYGQTGCGKTYTMMGRGDNSGGIVEMSLKDIFDTCAERVVKVSMYELYMDNWIDLLASSPVEIRGQRLIGTLLVVRSVEAAMSAIRDGERLLHVATTTMNAASSRSHTVIKITVEPQVMGAAAVTNSPAVLCLVDLAGYESGKSVAPGDPVIRVQEAKFINQSLLGFGMMVKEPSNVHRSSKLTMLRGAFGGFGRTSFLCCLSPAATDSYTVGFAAEVMGITNKPMASVQPFAPKVDNNELVVAGLARELECARGDFDRVKLEDQALKVENDNLKFELAVKDAELAQILEAHQSALAVKDAELAQILEAHQSALAEKDAELAEKDAELVQALEDAHQLANDYAELCFCAWLAEKKTNEKLLAEMAQLKADRGRKLPGSEPEDGERLRAVSTPPAAKAKPSIQPGSVARQKLRECQKKGVQACGCLYSACSDLRCGCVKNGARCTPHCQCVPGTCTNRVQ